MVKGFSSRAIENSLSDCMFRGTRWKLYCGSLGKCCLAQSSGNGWICHCLVLVVWVTLTSEPFEICFPAQELARCWKMFLLFCFSWRKQLFTWEIMSGQFFCIYSYNFILVLLFFLRYCDSQLTITRWERQTPNGNNDALMRAHTVVWIRVDDAVPEVSCVNYWE